MGNAGSSNQTQQEATAESIRVLEKQRQDLVFRQKRHLDQASNILEQARGFKAKNDVGCALTCLKRYKQIKDQATTIGNMISTLDAHSRSLETKLITNETMSVMKQTAEQLSNASTLTASSVDDFILDTEESQNDLRNLAQAMCMTDDGVDDDELLALLAQPATASTPTTPLTAPPSLVPADTDTDPSLTIAQAIPFHDDAQFITDLEAAVTELMMPSVPTKTPKFGACGDPPRPPPHYTATVQLNI
jgi:hypothetical protein